MKRHKKHTPTLLMVAYLCSQCATYHTRPDVLFFWHARTAQETVYQK